MKGKIWSLITILVMLSLVITAGCATGAASPTAEVKATTEPTTPPTQVPTGSDVVEITILVGFGTGTDPSQIDLHNQIAEEFNSTHPDIHVTFVTVAYEEHDSKFSTMLAGDMAPDIVMPIGVMGVAAYYDEWMDISPYIERDQYDTSDFYGPALQLQTYPDKMVGLPIGVYPSVTFYNEDLFDKANLEYPPHTFGDPNWTYDKLVETAQKLTLDQNGHDAASADFDPENIVQWGWDGWDWLPWRMVPAKFGGNPLGMSADFKTAEMETDAWKEGLQFVSDSIWKYHIRPTGELSTASFTDIDPLQSGEVAMWESFSWMAYNYETWTQAFNWNVAAVPAGPHGNIVAEANGDSFVIPKHSKHPDQAWEVAKWLMQPEIMARLAESYGCIPARKSLAGGWLEQMKAAYPKVDFQVFIDSINYMDASPNHEGWVPNYNKVWDAMENTMSLVTLGTNTDIEALLSALNGEVQGYLDEYWANK